MSRTGSDGDPLQRARGLTSASEAKALYEEWAERYDTDVFDTIGVTGSRRVADLLAERVPDRSTPIVDLGCGTGVVGEHLAAHGFTTLTGIDFSSAMLAVARRRGGYGDLVEGDLNEPPSFAARFGASVSAGTFTTGHVTAAAVPRVLDLLEPGATLVWSVAPAFWSEFDAALRHHGVRVLRSEAEPIRRDGDDRSHMVVGVYERR